MQLVYFWLFFNVMTNLPAIFCPAKALALGYVSAEKMPTDKGATMTLEFYMGFQMMNFQLTVGALILFIISPIVIPCVFANAFISSARACSA